MKIIKKTVFAAAVLLNSSTVYASTWNFLTARGDDNAIFFFDADSVDKTEAKMVTLWVKSVRTRTVDTDGSWATASRWKFNCADHTIQTLANSTYDRKGVFTKSFPNPSPAESTVPDSIGEQVQNIVCESNFPNDTSGKIYFKIADNDVFGATKTYVDIVDAQKAAQRK